MSVDIACVCGRVHDAVSAFPVRCRCGYSMPAPQGFVQETINAVAHRRTAVRQERSRARESFSICRTNRCGHWGEHDCGGFKRTGCGLLQAETGLKPCRTFDYILKGGGCLADPPLFGADDSQRVTFRMPHETIPQATSDRLVVVVIAGKEAEEQFEVTGPAIETYAKRCGADFRIVDGNHCPAWPMANKWRISPYVAAYERTLYLDVDVIVRPDAPSIFDAVPAERIGIYDEYDETIGNVEADWIQRDSDNISDLMGWPKSRRTWSANGGVMLLPRWSASLYQPPAKPFPKLWCLDQAMLTQQLDRYGIRPYLLDRQWNHGFVGETFWGGLARAHFVHLNGSRPHSYRMQLLQRIASGDFSRIDPPPESDWRPQWARPKYYS